MTSLSKFILILIFHMQSSSANKFRPAIVGGSPCSVEKHPYYVTLSGSHTCGGTLVTYGWVLTVAHCIMPIHEEKDKLLIRAGYDGKILHHVQYRKVAEAYKHPKYDLDKAQKDPPEFRHDVGMLKLNRPFEPSFVVKVVRLPSQGYAAKCKKGMAMGIGRTEPLLDFKDFNNWDPGLACILLTIVSREICRETWAGSIVDKTVICTREGEKNKDACQGDSGGPLVCNHTIIGIISVGKGCGNPGYSAIHVNVEYFLPFIKEKIRPKDKNLEPELIATKISSHGIRSRKLNNFLISLLTVHLMLS